MVSSGSTTARKFAHITLVFLLVASGSLAAAIPPIPEVAKDLDGPVETVEIEQIRFEAERDAAARAFHAPSASHESTSGQSERTQRDVLHYEDGLLVEQLRYEEGDKLTWRATREYNDERRLVDWRAMDGERDLNWRYEYVYDSSGRVVREIAYGEDGRLEQILLREYQDNELVEDVMYGPDNAIQWRKAYEQNEEERTREWSVYYSDGTRIKQIRQKRDGRGRLLEETHTDQLGAIYERIEYTYGPHEQPILIEEFDGSGDLQRRTEFELNEQGNVEEKHVEVPDNETSERVSRDFVYDEFGNWVQQRVITELLNGDEREVVEEKVIRRSIEYETNS